MENQMRGPTKRTASVEGSWNKTLETVKMKMATEYRFPYSSRSSIIEVTEAEDMMPESSRFKLQRMPAMVHNRKSTFNRMVLSSLHSSSLRSSVVCVSSSSCFCRLTETSSCSESAFCPEAMPDDMYASRALVKGKLEENSQLRVSFCKTRAACLDLKTDIYIPRGEYIAYYLPCKRDQPRFYRSGLHRFVVARPCPGRP